MKKAVGHTIAVLATIIVGVFAGVIGLALGHLIEEPGATSVAFAFVGVGIFYGAALYRGSPDNNEWRLIERNKQYWDVKMGGWRFAFPLIDRVREAGSFAGFDVELFLDNAAPAGADRREVLNFSGGSSAPVDASGWVQIGNPSNAPEEVREAVKKWVYQVAMDDKQVTSGNKGEKERLEAVAEQYESVLRPLLQGLTLEEAQTASATTAAQSSLSEVVRAAVTAAEPGLATLGVYPMRERGIIIRGVELPENVVRLRQLEFEGQEQALQLSRETRAIHQIMKDAQEAGSVMTFDAARELFLTQEGLRTLRESKANITVVARDMGGAINAITLNPRGGQSS